MLRRLRALLLRLYPGEFRDDYGDEWSTDFDARARAEGRRFWPGAILDTLHTAAVEHAAILRQDVRFALRSLRSNPIFACAAIVAIAAGIAANTAMFSLLRAALIQSAPYPDPDRLMVISSVLRGREQDTQWVSGEDYDFFRDGLRTFDSVSAFSAPGVTIRMDGFPERHLGGAFTGPVFAQLGAATIVGRLPSPIDHQPGAPPTVVLDYGFWQARFGSRPGVIGEPLWIDGRPHTIIGVLDDRFRFPLTANVWIPAARHPADETLFVMGRLAPGAMPPAAVAELETRLRPDARRERGFVVQSLRETSVAGFRPALIAFQAGAALLLLIAAANVSNLLASRAISRRGEFAIRLALGAGPRRLVRQAVTEAMTLAAIGGVVAAISARWLIDLLARLLPSGLVLDSWLVKPEDIRLDGGVLLYCGLLTAAAGLLFGLAPAWMNVRPDQRVLTPRSRSRRILTVFQTALATALLVGAVLLARTVARLESSPMGFDTHYLMRVRVGTEQPPHFVDQALEISRRLPGVRSAAMTTWLPLGGPRMRVQYEGGDAQLREVTSGYFETIGIPLRLGRSIGPEDRFGGRPVAVVSESVARQAWPGRDPLAQTIRISRNGRAAACAVVGVVADIRAFGPTSPFTPAIYVPAAQEPWASAELREIALRLNPGSPAPAAELRKALAAIAPEMPVYRIVPMDRSIENSLGQTYFSADLFRWLALVAGALAVLGLYATVSYQVAAQSREIGLRMALGATRSRVVGAVLVTSLRVIGIGVVSGVALAAALSRLLAAAVPGAAGLTIGPVAAAAVVFCMAGAAAALGPALRAAMVDPVSSLRQP